jgi:hypothetical protein
MKTSHHLQTLSCPHGQYLPSPPPLRWGGGLLFKHPESEFKEKHGVRDPKLELSQTSPYLRIESKVSILPLSIINPKGKGVGGNGHRSLLLVELKCIGS